MLPRIEQNHIVAVQQLRIAFDQNGEVVPVAEVRHALPGVPRSWTEPRISRARRFAEDSPLEEGRFEPGPAANGTAMGGPPKSILAISDLTLGGSTDRADVPIGNAQQSLLQQRDRWFESGSLQQRAGLTSRLHASGRPRQKLRRAKCSVSNPTTPTSPDP
jgi:hypothetical protein